MTKFTLLTATALTAIALSGAASAADVTGAKVSNIALTTGATPISYRLATETLAGTSNANIQTTQTLGHNEILSTLSTGTAFFDPNAGGTSYSATITYTGATFSTAIAASRIAVTGQTGGCVIAAPTIVSGGGAGQNTLTAVFNVPNTCTVGGAGNSPTGVSFDIPFVMNSATTSTVTASVGYAIASSGAAYGGANGVVTLVSRAAAYTTGVSASPLTTTALPTQFALGTTPPAYTALRANSGSIDSIIGSIKATTAAAGLTTGTANAGGVYASLANPATGIPALTYTATLTGNYAVVKPHVATSDANALVPTPATPDLVVVTGNASATLASSSGDRSVYVEVSGANTTSVTTPVSTSASVTYVSATPALIPSPTAVNATALEVVGQEGTNFVAPWFPLANNNNIGTLRISNGGSINTGPITLVLSSDNATTNPTNSSCTLTQAMLTSDSDTLASGGIPANGAIFVAGNTLATSLCFGTTALNGDVRVIVQGLKTDLTAKVRVRNVASGSTFESSLGRLGDVTNIAF